MSRLMYLLVGILLAMQVALGNPSSQSSDSGAVDKTQETRKRSRASNELDSKESPLAKRAHVAPSTSTAALPYVHREALSSGFHLISGPDAHKRHLLKSLRNARKSVLIASYGLYINALENKDLFDLFGMLARKNVVIDLYGKNFDVNNRKLDKTLSGLLGISQLGFYAINNHSKIIIIDNKILYLGSFNWLERAANPSENVSIKISGQCAQPIIEAYKAYLRKYFVMHREDNGTFGDTHEQFSDLFSTDPRYRSKQVVYRNPSQKKNGFTLLTTPDQHYHFMTSAIRSAQRYVEIHSPFVANAERQKRQGRSVVTLNPLADRLIKKDIFQLSRAGKKLAIYYTREQDTDILAEHLSSYIPYGHVTYTQVPNFHHKILVVDGQKIAIGSWNWLSADLEVAPDANNDYNTSLLIEGPDATEIIDELRKRNILKLS